MNAFDSVKRNKILDSLTQNKIPSKLIRLIKLTLQNTTAKVKVNNAYTIVSLTPTHALVLSYTKFT